MAINTRALEYELDALVKAFGCSGEDITIDYGESGATIDGTYVDYSSEDMREIKNRLKKHVYDLLSEKTGITLPWGTLTGIRPTKFPMDMFREGRSEEEVFRYMKDSFQTSDVKIKLAGNIAKKELEILKRLDLQSGFSLYIGIPFCPSRCFYCSFASYPADKRAKDMAGYVDCVIRELEEVSRLTKNRRLCSVYVGGGTPTALDEILLDKLLTSLDDLFDMDGVCEYTVESGRPDSITKEKLGVLKRHGVSRICINPQTMNDETLKIIGRKHSAKDIRDSFLLAREMGFDNINMDLILGLPKEGRDEVARTFDEIEKLRPDGITVHSLAVKRTAKLNLESEEYEDYTMINTDELVELAAERCNDMGLLPYYMYRQKNMKGNFENVGYAREGCEGIYNILMMEDIQDVVAVGAGTVSKIFASPGHAKRYDNVKDLDTYFERFSEVLAKKNNYYL